MKVLSVFLAVCVGFSCCSLLPLGSRSEANGSESSGSRIIRRQATIPASIDWRTEGAVTPVKNQGKNCHTSYAFATVGALEGQRYRYTGSLIELSEQNLIDCYPGNDGCNGGDTPDGNYAWIRDNEGIESRESYPYEGNKGECRYDNSKVAATVTGSLEIEDNEEALMLAVADGPVAALVDASQWELYRFGIFRCRLPLTENLAPYNLNHAVVVVGYGTSLLGDFWIVKNSWGTSWGENGYIRIARNANNQCGIASSASYPTL